MIRLSAYCLFFFLNKFLLKWHLSANLSGPINVVNTHGPSSAPAPYFKLSERWAVAGQDAGGRLGGPPALGPEELVSALSGAH